MDVSENGGTPKSSILIGYSITNHPFWGTYFWKHPYTDGLGGTSSDNRVLFGGNIDN